MYFFRALLSPVVMWPALVSGKSNSNTANYTVEELWDLEVTFWDNFLYPANVKQVEAINSTLFTTEVCGQLLFPSKNH